MHTDRTICEYSLAKQLEIREIQFCLENIHFGDVGSAGVEEGQDALRNCDKHRRQACVLIRHIEQDFLIR